MSRAIVWALVLVVGGCGDDASSGPEDTGVDASGEDAGRDAGGGDVDGGVDAGGPIDAGGDAGDCPPGTTRCGESCVDLGSDVAHCGACGFDCTAVPHLLDPISCIDGLCQAGGCELGWDDCTTDEGRQCETSVRTAARCGRCDTPCPDGLPVCREFDSGGTPRLGCDSTCPAGTLECAGACIDTETDEANCGGCGNVCPPLANGAHTCEFGSCRPRCDAGFHACEGRCVPDDAPASCGASCTPCPTRVNMRATCDGTACGLECEPGFADCDGNPLTGCEADIRVDFRCGACDVRCDPPAGVCAPDASGGWSCASGCPAAAPTACASACVDTATDPANCGGCGTVCPIPVFGAPVCVAGACGVTCDPGYHACGSGCVRDDSVATCGTSCTACPVEANALPTCDGARCRSQCVAGHGDCTRAVPGCETWLASNSHCGACGVACTGARPFCAFDGESFTCVSGCADGQERCGDTCSDTAVDPRNCGGCGNDCWALPRPDNAYAVCVAGECDFACVAGTHPCGEECVSNFDVDHCGASCLPCATPPGSTARCDGVRCRSQLAVLMMTVPRCRLDSDCQDADWCNGYEVCDPMAPGANVFGCVAGASPCPAGAACTGRSCILACTPPDIPAGAGGAGDDDLRCPCDGYDREIDHALCRTLYGPESYCAEASFGSAVLYGLTCGCVTPPDYYGPVGLGIGAERPIPCSRNADCSDGQFCNGVERCLTPPPPDHDRGGFCYGGRFLPCAAGEICDEASDRCLSMDCTDTDYDNDGVDRIACGGTDCDDGDPNRYPGNPEVCDAMGHDEDCIPCTVANMITRDGDRDSDRYLSDDCTNSYFGTAPTCDPMLVAVDEVRGIIVGRDCDDADASRQPAAADICNGFDDDCDGVIDDGTATRYYRDRDGDGAADPACSSWRCGPAAGYTLTRGDCDDSDPVLRIGSQTCDPGAPGVLVCTGGTWEHRDCPMGTTCRPQPDGTGTCL